MTIREQYQSLKRQKEYLQSQLRENEADLKMLQNSCAHLDKAETEIAYTEMYECKDCGLRFGCRHHNLCHIFARNDKDEMVTVMECPFCKMIFWDTAEKIPNKEMGYI